MKGSLNCCCVQRGPESRLASSGLCSQVRGSGSFHIKDVTDMEDYETGKIVVNRVQLQGSNFFKSINIPASVFISEKGLNISTSFLSNNFPLAKAVGAQRLSGSSSPYCRRTDCFLISAVCLHLKGPQTDYGQLPSLSPTQKVICEGPSHSLPSFTPSNPRSSHPNRVCTAMSYVLFSNHDCGS